MCPPFQGEVRHKRHKQIRAKEEDGHNNHSARPEDNCPRTKLVPHGTGEESMAVNAYVLIETEVGKSRAVANRLNEMAVNGYSGRLSGIDTVTGPYDVIAKITHDDLDGVGELVTEGVQKIDGVQRTTTCLATKL